ncbi:hypothetical protein G7Y89_g5653 [Cudoniella acicularis]|uniref:RING-type domain-containing protein n=1 Tax=Cudoniella acicularis TaxID=354080 RepID=A0A8H4RNG8_9HELO|nr:hypothetical protein G7Y89_g5653 [Cudoniella acicularis]
MHASIVGQTVHDLARGTLYIIGTLCAVLCIRPYVRFLDVNFIPLSSFLVGIIELLCAHVLLRKNGVDIFDLWYFWRAARAPVFENKDAIPEEDSDSEEPDIDEREEEEHTGPLREPPYLMIKPIPPLPLDSGLLLPMVYYRIDCSERHVEKAVEKERPKAYTKFLNHLFKKVRLSGIPKEERECAICREQLETPTPGMPLDRMHRAVELRCGRQHVFGSSCIWEWMKEGRGHSNGPSCPYCRAKVELPSHIWNEKSAKVSAWVEHRQKFSNNLLLWLRNELSFRLYMSDHGFAVTDHEWIDILVYIILGLKASEAAQDLADTIGLAYVVVSFLNQEAPHSATLQARVDVNAVVVARWTSDELDRYVTSCIEDLITSASSLEYQGRRGSSLHRMDVEFLDNPHLRMFLEGDRHFSVEYWIFEARMACKAIEPLVDENHLIKTLLLERIKILMNSMRNNLTLVTAAQQVQILLKRMGQIVIKNERNFVLN